MPYSVLSLRTAVRDLAALPKDVQRQIGEKIDTLAENPLPPGVQKLRGEDTLYRIRIGDYRAIYEVDHSEKTVTIATIGHRRDIYRKR